MLSAVLRKVIMLSVVMLNVVMLSVVASISQPKARQTEGKSVTKLTDTKLNNLQLILSVVMGNVIMLSVVVPTNSQLDQKMSISVHSEQVRNKENDWAK
jgi:hypothetical protein